MKLGVDVVVTKHGTSYHNAPGVDRARDAVAVGWLTRPAACRKTTGRFS